MSRILVVDDEETICWGIAQLAKGMGYDVDTASSAEQGLRLAANSTFDLLILDVRLPGCNGLTAMERFRELLGPLPIVIITAFGDLQTAVCAVQNGAFEYVLKPFDLAEIRSTIRRAFRSAEPQGPDSAVRPLDGILGRDVQMQTVFKRIALAADADVSVLLQGESGVGKDLAAHAIHRHSARSAGPFVAVNVAALSPTLAEAELFGHVSGAFTGAVQSRKGLLVEADGGTLFLDEVAEIPLSIQVKLLRALDQGEVLPLGADQPVQTSFRVVSATHQDLLDRVQAGQFRHDLFYRLSAFEITIPPLRERKGDIAPLAQYFAAELRKEPVAFAQETLTELMRRPWYGNVRELRNAVEHALVLARCGVILPEHLPAPLPTLSRAGHSSEPTAVSIEAIARQRALALLNDPAIAGEVYHKFLEEVEPALLESALDRYSQECAPAARALGVHRTTLKRKLDQYGLAK